MQFGGAAGPYGEEAERRDIAPGQRACYEWAGATSSLVRRRGLQAAPAAWHRADACGTNGQMNELQKEINDLQRQNKDLKTDKKNLGVRLFLCACSVSVLVVCVQAQA